MVALEFSGLNSRIKVCLVLGYDPNEGDRKERFWNDIGKILDSVRNRYRFVF